MIPFCFVIFQMVVGLVRPQAGKSLVWSRWLRHRILHFKYMHLVCEIDETQKLSAATGIIPMSPYAGYRPNNVWSEWLGAYENSRVRRRTSCGCRGPHDKGSGDASQEAGAVRLVLGISDHEFPVGSSWVVTRPIPCVMVGSWIMTSLSLRRMARARRPVTVTSQQWRHLAIQRG